MYKVFYYAYLAITGNMGVAAFLVDSTNTSSGAIQVPITLTYSDTSATYMAQVPAAVDAWTLANYGFTTSSGEWLTNPLGMSKSFSYPTRSLNTAFQPSTALDTVGIYSVSIASTLTLTTGQLGSEVLETADDVSITVNVKTCATVANGNTGALSIGVNTVNTQGGVLSCFIPKGKYARIRTVSTTGSPTFSSSITAQETQF